MILHIAPRSDWERAKSAGKYEPDSLRLQGLIHCSRPDQVLAVAEGLFRGETDLVLLCIDPERVSSDVREENLEGGPKLFPHIYGPLNLDAVMAVLDFRPNEDGAFALPKQVLDWAAGEANAGSKQVSVGVLRSHDARTLRAIAAMECAAWGGPPGAGEIETRIRRLKRQLEESDRQRTGLLVARQLGVIVGVCRIRQSSEDLAVWILFGLAVHPDRRHRGIGRALVEKSIVFARSHGAKAIRSEAHADNTASIAFHEAIGFVNVGRFVATDGDEKIRFSMTLAR